MDQPDPRPTRDDEQQVVQRDVYCVSCDYNLRGLPLSGRCPECGAPAAQELRFADLVWLKGLIGGLEGLSATWLATLVVSVVIAILVFAVLTIYHPLWDTGLQAPAPCCLVFGFWMAMNALHVWAMLTATRVEPGGPVPEKGLSARRLALAACSIMFAGSVAAPAAFGLVAGFGSMQESMQELVLSAMLILFSLAFPFSLYALFSYLRPLASRVPDLGLTRSTDLFRRILLAGAGVCWGGFALAGTAYLLYGLFPIHVCFVVVWPIVVLVMLIRSVFLVLRYARRIEEVLEGQTDANKVVAQSSGQNG